MSSGLPGINALLATWIRVSTLPQVTLSLTVNDKPNAGCNGCNSYRGPDKPVVPNDHERSIFTRASDTIPTDRTFAQFRFKDEQIA